MKKKTISIMVPTYNEEENVVLMYEALKNIFQKELKKYNYEILFIDNKSQDKTRTLIREICAKDKNVKAIFNAQNFGQLIVLIMDLLVQQVIALFLLRLIFKTLWR